MLKTALLGDSYVKKFGRFYDGFLGVHIECRFYGVERIEWVRGLVVN